MSASSRDQSMSNDQNEFERAGQESRESIVTEFIHFLSENKKWWLTPILLVLGLVGLLVVLGSSGAAPFIYTLF